MGAMWAFLTLLQAASAADDGSCYAWLPAKNVASVEQVALTEISGLAASRAYANILWGHNDAGNVASIYAMNFDGEDMGAFFVPGAENVDWEDIALGPCGSESTDCSCLYIGDIGDNDRERGGGVIYRLPEPEPVADGQGQTVVPEAQPFRYPEGLSYDAEALLVHPLTGEIVLITKGDPASVFAFPDTFSGEEVELERIATLDLTALGVESPLATGADFSPRGKRIVVRTDADVVLFSVTGTIAAAFSSGQAPLPDPPAADAEAVAFSADGTALYLAGESVSPDLWTLQCVGYDSDTADTADPLVDCDDGTQCGCRGGGAAVVLLLPLLWYRPAQRPQMFRSSVSR